MKRAACLWFGPLVAAGTVVVACSGSGGNGGFLTIGTSPDGGPVTVATNPDGSVSMVLPTGSLPPGSGSGSGATVVPGAPCTFMDATDHDGDGWSFATGDCNDCNPDINPGAYDIPGNQVDDDCDGTVDNEIATCDTGLPEATTMGAEAAKAVDLCRTTTAGATGKQKTWGVIDAEYVLPDNAPCSAENDCNSNAGNFNLGFGILSQFGPKNHVQGGASMLAISSGTARQPADQGYQDVGGFMKGFGSGAPSGFPGQTPACGPVFFGAPNDGAALRLVIRVPTNAKTMSFDSNFFSYEFPEYVCSPYNDTYVVIMTPSPAGEPASAHDNIAFDTKGNIVSVNAGFLTVCDQPGANGSLASCSEGPGKLQGTGFGVDTTMDENHASSDWLTTTVSVAQYAGKEITLLFAVWDSTDEILDTTVLVDNFTWSFTAGSNSGSPPMTAPVTQPK